METMDVKQEYLLIGQCKIIVRVRDHAIGRWHDAFEFTFMAKRTLEFAAERSYHD